MQSKPIESLIPPHVGNWCISSFPNIGKIIHFFNNRIYRPLSTLLIGNKAMGDICGVGYVK